jgi:hypothetical protein
VFLQDKVNIKDVALSNGRGLKTTSTNKDNEREVIRETRVIDGEIVQQEVQRSAEHKPTAT